MGDLRLSRQKLIRAFFFCLYWAFLILPTLAKPHAGVDYTKLKVAGIPIHLVDVDLHRNDLVVRPVVVPAGQRKDFSGLVSTYRPVAAVNGTFFDTTTGVTVGNLVSNGRLLSEGMAGSNLVFRKDGTFSLQSSSRNLGRYQDWSDVEFAVGGGPTLLSEKHFFMNPASEGFKDPSLFRPRPRSAIGVTENGHLQMVVVTQNVTLWQLAQIMKSLNCVHAINLDGGTSTGLSVGGKTVVRPGRGMTNILGVFPAYQAPTQARAVQVAQSRALAHYNKGQVLMSRGNVRLARSQMRQAVAKAPEQAGFWRAAGLAEHSFGNSKQAVRDLKRASLLYLRRGDFQAANLMMEKVLTINPKDLSANLSCGTNKFKRGLDSEALGHLEYVLRAQPGHPKAQSLVQVLKLKKNACYKLTNVGTCLIQAF